jgi:hypothetical protein
MDWYVRTRPLRTIVRPSLQRVPVFLLTQPRIPAESGHLFRTIPDTAPAQSGQASG